MRKDPSSSGGKIPFVSGGKGRYLLVAAICLGLLALLWPSGRGERVPADMVPRTDGKAVGTRAELAVELEAILAQIEGAGQVQVSISLESDGQKTFASNERNEMRETAENGPGGTVKKISEKNTTRDLAVSGGNPLLVENRYPRVTGVLVVAEGAGSPAVCERLINATTTLLNISPHQVSVMPRRAGNE